MRLRNPAKILVVDDDASTRAALSVLLADAGREILTAESGVEALRRCLKDDFAVVILDVRMPGMDGYEAAALIRSRPASARTPIIFLTGSEADIDRMRGYTAGAVDYLLKPVETFILATKVRVFVELWEAREEVRALEAEAARRRMEAEVAEQRAQMDAQMRNLLLRQALILRSVPVVLCTRKSADPLKVPWVSDNVSRVLGSPPAAFEADPGFWRDRLHPDDEALVNAGLEGAESAGSARFAYRWRVDDGAWRWIQESVAVPDPRGDELHGVWFDIHEQKEMADALRAANEDLDRRVAERTAELEQALAELDSFSYSVSHDLRAPLRSINAFSRMLVEGRSGDLTDEERFAQSRLLAAVARIDALIDDLLRLARVVRVPVAPTRVDLSRLADEIVAGLREREPGREVNVRVAADLDAEGDEGLLRVMLENLFSNAWKFTRGRDDASIEFGRAPDNGRAFFVRDNGVGFDMAHAEQLFRPFHRLHSAAAFEGTGIGLATVRRVVQRHGGKVWVDAAPDKGATFYFALGRAPAEPTPGA